MSTTVLAIQLFASMFALMASYALLMSIFKREVNATWVRGESLLTLIAAGTALSFNFRTLIDGGEVFSIASVLFLILGFANALALVVTHRLVLKRDGAPYHESLVSVTKWIAVAAFASFLLHVFAQFAAIAGF